MISASLPDEHEDEFERSLYAVPDDLPPLPEMQPMERCKTKRVKALNEIEKMRAKLVSVK
jgi:hypothetical protein